MQRHSKEERGYNLIEILIAVALLGSVLLGIMTLFFMGRANVYAGKQLTRAVAAGTRVLEDITAMTAQDVITQMALDDTLTTNTFDGVEYDDTAMVTIDKNSTFTTATDPLGYKAQWKELITDESFNSGRVRLLFIPRTPLDSTLPMTTAQILQIRGAIEWNEARRVRRMTFDTTKVYRR